MKKIAITTTSFGEYDEHPVGALKKSGFEIVLNPYGRKLKRDEVVQICQKVIGIIAGTETLDADVLEKLTMLKVISRCGAGVDNVNLTAAGKLGIKVFNTPDAPTMAVAELTICLIWSLLRKINQMDKELRNGKWEKLMGNLISGKKVGIIGLGRIGKKVAELLISLGCEIAYTDLFKTNSLLGFKYLRLEELLGWADIITIHTSTKEMLIGGREIQQMKKGVFLINTSRGGVIDEESLYINLKNGYVSGAALDVFKQEPYSGKLTELDNVILTPHIGSYAKESRVEMERQSVENLLKGLEGVI